MTKMNWIRLHPLPAAVRGAWIAFASLAGGALAGAIAWLPLQLDPPVALLLGGAAGLALAVLWTRQQRAALRGDARTARGWGIALLAAPLIAILVVGAVSAKQMIDAGVWQVPGEDRLAAFDRLWRAMRDNYPYFDIKGVDWDDAYARYRPQVAGARDDDAYFRAIAAMLAELGDGHTELSSPSPRLDCYGTAVEIEGQILLSQLGYSATAAGLERGMALRAVQGRDIDDAIAALDVRLRDGSTPRQRRHTAINNLLCASQDQPLDVTVETAAGEEREIALTVVNAPESGGEARPLVTGERLPSGYGLIRVPVFYNRNGRDVVAEFDAALDAMMDAPGVILDLRGNGGGGTMVADGVAGRFYRQPFTYIRQTFRQALPLRIWRTVTDWQVAPRGVAYDGPVVLLIDVSNASSAEDFIVSMTDSGRARSVGRVTGGMSGNPVNFSLPGGGEARFSTGDIRRMNGQRIEGAGVTPDVPVAWTVDNFRAGRDPDVAAAVALLQSAAP